MHDDPRPANNPSPQDELSGSLRRAVEQVRQEPVPKEALDRSLNKAQCFDAPRVVRWRNYRPLFALAGLAALLVVGVAVWCVEKPNNTANNKYVAIDRPPLPPSTMEDRRVREIVRHKEERMILEGLNDADKERPVADPSRPTNYDVGRTAQPSTPPPDAIHPEPPASERLYSFEAAKQLQQHWQEQEKRGAVTRGERSEEGQLPHPYKKADEGWGLTDHPLPVRRLASETSPGQQQGQDKGEGKEKDGKDSPKKPQVWHADRPPSQFRPGLRRCRQLAGAGQPAGQCHHRGAARRTVVDHIFHNPHDRQLEGTFEYPAADGSQPQLLSPCSSARRATRCRCASAAAATRRRCRRTLSPA